MTLEYPRRPGWRLAGGTDKAGAGACHGRSSWTFQVPMQRVIYTLHIYIYYIYIYTEYVNFANKLNTWISNDMRLCILCISNIYSVWILTGKKNHSCTKWKPCLAIEEVQVLLSKREKAPAFFVPALFWGMVLKILQSPTRFNLGKKFLWIAATTLERLSNSNFAIVLAVPKDLLKIENQLKPGGCGRNIT